MKTFLTIFGTRPEAIKMCPLIIELKKRTNCNTIVCVSGQHKQMLEPVLKFFQIIPDYNLDIMKHNQSLFDITNNILGNLKPILHEVNPDFVLVHGDTTTSFSAALAAFYSNIPVVHIEAGLRTYNLHNPYPEEFNRHAISIISKFHFAPTIYAYDNLINEHINPQTIFLAGNTVIDALSSTLCNNYTHPELNWVNSAPFILITCHRRENIGEPMKNIFRAIKRLLFDFPHIKAIFPIHMNPSIREIAIEELNDCSNLHIIEPLNVFDFHNFLYRCHLVLTDSGGIQEEGSYLGKPILVTRDNTERFECISTNNIRLIGTQETNIYENCKLLLCDNDEYRKMTIPTGIFGDGSASKKIVDILTNL